MGIARRPIALISLAWDGRSVTFRSVVTFHRGEQSRLRKCTRLVEDGCGVHTVDKWQAYEAPARQVLGNTNFFGPHSEQPHLSFSVLRKHSSTCFWPSQVFQAQPSKSDVKIQIFTPGKPHVPGAPCHPHGHGLPEFIALRLEYTAHFRETLRRMGNYLLYCKKSPLMHPGSVLEERQACTVLLLLRMHTSHSRKVAGSIA
jgi:hypothetical protein